MRLEKLRLDYYFLNYVPNSLISKLTNYVDHENPSQNIIKNIIQEFKALRLLPQL